MAKEETPLMRQYQAIKAQHPGALLLFRVGDFYETFGEDAVKASRILGIVLTRRNNGAAGEMALAGFPHHSLDTYLPRLVRAGERVAVCDQLEDPKSVKGIVKRGVTELVTPGVVMNDQVLDGKKNNYLAAVYADGDKAGISLLDVSTGEFWLTEGTLSYCEHLLRGTGAGEVLYSKSQKTLYQQHFEGSHAHYAMDEWIFAHSFAYDGLTQHFGTPTLKGYGVEDMPLGIIAAGAVLHYLKQAEHHHLSHISSLARIEPEGFMWLDRFTIRNLELVAPQYAGGVSLVEVMDRCVTPMGSRLLRRWLLMPLKDKAKIEERLDATETLVKDIAQADYLHSLLKPLGDPERLIARLAAQRVTPREMVQLNRTLEALPHILQALNGKRAMADIASRIELCEELKKDITQTLNPEAPAQLQAGNLINPAVHTELDELRSISKGGKDYLMMVQQREAERTGIGSLKVSYNKVFGYYIEVSNANKDKVPGDWIRKQTLTNAERYITEELKVYEEKILTAEEKIAAIEQSLYNALVQRAAQYVTRVQRSARALAMLDVHAGLAVLAERQHYCKPEIRDEALTDIKDGRHPVIEQQLPGGEQYVPNDMYLDDKTQQIIIITGPNMAGKSALLRQVALITIMAQLGSYVPAKAAVIGLTDKVFTRVGAGDNLSKGESTFMVEMNETASILNNLSARSLVLMDEIGRGTSTYDGISIAWSIVEYLHNHPQHKARTLFATHYHELNLLTNECERVKNYNVSVKESGNKVIFLRKLKQGGSEHSFGIHVAQMAGMPNEVVLRAHTLLHELEKNRKKDHNSKALKDAPKPLQMNLFDANDPNFVKVKEMLKGLDLNAMSPIEALLKLNEIKNLLD